jgi:hypothetical protein
VNQIFREFHQTPELSRAAKTKASLTKMMSSNIAYSLGSSDLIGGYEVDEGCGRLSVVHLGFTVTVSKDSISLSLLHPWHLRKVHLIEG